MQFTSLRLNHLKRDYELKTEKLNEQRDKILNKAREEAVDILKEAKETADEAIKTINKYGNPAIPAKWKNPEVMLEQSLKEPGRLIN